MARFRSLVDLHHRSVPFRSRTVLLTLIHRSQRPRLEDPVTLEWFNTFTVLFEVTSAYGTVGLSLGSEEVSCYLVDA